jgi:D-glycero-alpha-D-manno-heptose 1-phosphate guanylyltransferase
METLETAVIVAGGYGTRLLSVVPHVPKPMAPINKQPFLNYQLNYLLHSAIKNVVISTGHLAEKIKNYYGASYRGLNIRYVTEKIPLGTGGGIRLALEKADEKEVLILNGDSFFDIPVDAFNKLHGAQKSVASIALRKVDDASRYGTIVTDKRQRISSFSEKTNLAMPGTINGGVYILNTKTFMQHTPPGTAFSIETDFFEKQLGLPIYGFEFDGYFIDIGVPQDYARAQDDFKAFKYK